MSLSLAVTHLVPLAKEVDEDKVTPGVLGFIVFAVMALAVWGLMKSMTKHMGKVDFAESPESPEPRMPEASEPRGTPEGDASVGETATDAAGKRTPAKS